MDIDGQATIQQLADYQHMIGDVSSATNRELACMCETAARGILAYGAGTGRSVEAAIYGAALTSGRQPGHRRDGRRSKGISECIDASS